VNSIIYLCNTTLWPKGLEIKHILLLLSKLYFSYQTWKKAQCNHTTVIILMQPKIRISLVLQ